MDKYSVSLVRHCPILLKDWLNENITRDIKARYVHDEKLDKESVSVIIDNQCLDIDVWHKQNIISFEINAKKKKFLELLETLRRSINNERGSGSYISEVDFFLPQLKDRSDIELYVITNEWEQFVAIYALDRQHDYTNSKDKTGFPRLIDTDKQETWGYNDIDGLSLDEAIAFYKEKADKLLAIKNSLSLSGN